jgi:hypothetical protein
MSVSECIHMHREKQSKPLTSTCSEEHSVATSSHQTARSASFEGAASRSKVLCTCRQSQSPCVVDTHYIPDIYTHVHIYIHMYTHTHTHVRIHVHIHIRMYIHTHIHTYIHYGSFRAVEPKAAESKGQMGLQQLANIISVLEK